MPGDFVIGRGSFRLYIPLATSLVVSVVLSLLAGQIAVRREFHRVVRQVVPKQGCRAEGTIRTRRLVDGRALGSPYREADDFYVLAVGISFINV